MFADKRRLNLLLTLLFVWIAAYPAISQTSSNLTSAGAESQTERIARLEQAVTEAKSSADNSWMLVSSALVLLMTGPGLALFYGGLVRKKNVLATMMQSFALMAIKAKLCIMVASTFFLRTSPP